MRGSPVLLALLAACFLLLAPVHAWAQGRADRGVPEAEAAWSMADVVARLPRSAELVVVVDAAAELRRTPLWTTFRPLLGGMGAFEQTERSWDALARQLGWESEEAFDRIVGRRVVLVVRGLGGGDPLGPPAAKAGEPSAARWAILCEVSADTDRRLLERLKAAPRDIVRGHQILSIEGGAYELAINRRRGGAGGEWGGGGGGGGARRDDGRATVVLGPAGKSELFDELLEVLSKGAPSPIRGTAAHAAAQRLGPADALVLQRSPGDPGREWSDFSAIAVRRDGAARWVARLVFRDEKSRAALLGVPVTSDAAFRALSADALGAILETRAPEDLDESLGANPVSWVLQRLGVPPHLHEQIGERQALLLRPTPGPPGIGVAIAAEMRDVDAAASAGDAFIAETVGLIERELGAPGDLPELPVLGGVAPAAVRVLPIAAPEGVLAPLFGGASPVVAWSFAPGGSAPAGAGPRPGWWTIGVAACPPGDPSAASKLVRTMSDALTAEGSGGGESRRRWFWQGFLHPARIEASLALPVPEFANVRGFLRRVSNLSWEAHVTDDGELEGSIRLDVTGVGAK